jgi:hypothetical protein
LKREQGGSGQKQDHAFHVDSPIFHLFSFSSFHFVSFNYRSAAIGQVSVARGAPQKACMRRHLPVQEGNLNMAPSMAPSIKKIKVRQATRFLLTHGSMMKGILRACMICRMAFHALSGPASVNTGGPAVRILQSG